MMTITINITRINNPNKKFFTKTDFITSAKHAINKQPLTVPIDIAKKVFHGFIPIRRPSIEPTRPPDP